MQRNSSDSATMSKLRKRSHEFFGIRLWMHKFRVNLNKVSSEVLSDSSVSDYGKRTVDALFNGSTEISPDWVEQERYLEDASARSLSTTDQEQTACSSNTEEVTEEYTFSSYDPIKQRELLSSQCSGPFIRGPEIWETRRKLWTARSENNTEDGAAAHKANFEKIKPQYYPRIYKKLVVDDRSLSEPVNLSDVMKIIEAGWVEKKKWELASKGLC
ncbi:HCL207Wp [Eremothecium sinecaudum]|uniref:HCL207Wp n=1 Tax=Eremothecium sinecaudum TaxID=45286 RepID=A0A0X8HR69_9SACH|nr:HCL207Wp [Eremothecium sinecaudum]AMD19944.1 HCL207Wp [Eremothecium sinecaudum]